MSSIINITPEQAAALLPVLQSIASQSQARRNDSSSDSSQDSSINSSFVHADSSEEHDEDHLDRKSEEEVYELKELLTKKKEIQNQQRLRIFYMLVFHMAVVQLEI